MAKKRTKKGGIFILLLLFIVAVIMVFTTPVFKITTVMVNGNEKVSREEVLAAASLPPGKNIYTVSMKEAKARVEALPYVLSAEVKRKFPARVSIQITERAEAAAMQCTGGYAILDKEGRVLRIAADAENVCTVSGTTVTNAVPGQTIGLEDGRFLDNLKTLLTETQSAGVQENIKQIRIPSAVDVVLVTRGDMEIQLAGMDELSYKLKLCCNILNGGYEGVNKDSGGVLRWTSEGKFSYRKSKN